LAGYILFIILLENLNGDSGLTVSTAALKHLSNFLNKISLSKLINLYQDFLLVRFANVGTKIKIFKSLAGKLGIALVFDDVNNDISSDLEIKTPVLFFFSFLLIYRILGFLNF